MALPYPLEIGKSGKEIIKQYFICFVRRALTKNASMNLYDQSELEKVVAKFEHLQQRWRSTLFPLSTTTGNKLCRFQNCLRKFRRAEKLYDRLKQRAISLGIKVQRLLAEPLVVADALAVGVEALALVEESHAPTYITMVPK